MLTDTVKRCLQRDLAGFAAELDGYRDDAQVWALPVEMKNSTGTLVVHVCGSLRHFIGGILGKSGYVRDRDAEFAVRNLPRVELEMLIAVTRDEITRALDHLDPATLSKDFPVPVGGVSLHTGRFLVHHATHVAYHLGQADIHRRVVTGSSAAVGTISPTAIADPVVP
ncbi:MAG TPA: DUF664 domain-containing protein [Gemmatimonadales bacterium]|jgi:uncharacterized damage-inducible protein DinB|nr:DUF664 domain-containing protein [Gemmatimonadales bacterium]